MYSSAFDMMPPPGDQGEASGGSDDVGDVGTSRAYERRVVHTTRHNNGDEGLGGSSILNDNIYLPRSTGRSSRTTTKSSSYSSPGYQQQGSSSRSFGHRPETVVYNESRGSQRPSGSSSRSREIESDFDSFHNSREHYFDGASSADMRRPPGGKKFLKKVQHELEEQRSEWADEINKLTTSPLINPVKGQGKPEGSNSYVDTRSGAPIFKAFVDVHEFPADRVSVSVDNVSNKIVVRADQGKGTMTRTFTQKVQLPRYADEAKVRSFMSKNGVLKLEVPLLFYFPMYALQKDGKPAKSFVNEVKTRSDGRQFLEILVNTGSDYRARDLHVRVMDDDKLVITAEKPTTSGRMKQKVIKQYTLPKLADIDDITSKLGSDGRLVVTIPLLRSSREGTPTTMSPPMTPTR